MESSAHSIDEESAPPFDLKDVFYAIVRSWMLIGIFASIGFAAGIYQAASKANYYTSHAKLLLRVGARENVSQEDIAGATTGRGRDVAPGIEDEIHMLTGQALYARLAKKIGPGEILTPADPTRFLDAEAPLHKRLFHELQAWLGGFRKEKTDVESEAGTPSLKAATERLMNGTNIRPERRSSVISVSYTANSEKTAQAHLEMIVQGFIDRHLEQYSTLDEAKAARERYENARDAYEEVRADYFAHTSECGNPIIEQELSDLLASIAARKDQAFDAQGRREEIAAQIAELGRQMNELPPTVEVEQPAVVRDNPDYTAALQSRSNYMVLKDNVQFENILNERKAELSAHYDARIREADQLLATLDPLIVVEEASVEPVPNPALETMRSKIRDLQVEDSSLEKQLENLLEGIEKQEATRGEMMDCQRRHGELLDEQEKLRSNFVRRREQWEKLDALATIDETGKTNLTVMEPPDLPLEKSGPSRGKLVLFGLVAGAAAGFGIAMVRQLMDPRLRHPHNVERSLDVPLIAVVPDSRRGRDLRSARPLEPASTIG